MDVVGVRVEVASSSPIVVLREREGPRLLPIYIGGPEATAIALALDGVGTPRPMTHDLIRDVFDELAVDVERVVVTELRDKTFFAELHLRHGGEAHVVSSRPSDAIAIAVRTGTPVYAEDQVLDEAGYVEEDEAAEGEDGEEAEEVVEQFREFIDSISPEDFED